MSFSPPSYNDLEAALVRGTFLRSYVRWGAQQTDAPMPFHILGALAAIASVAPEDLSMPTYGGVVHANIYALIVGPSGVSRKSTVINMSAELVREVAPKRLGPLPDSVEGMIESLGEQSSQTLIYSEFGEILAKSASGRLEPIRTFFTNAWDGNPYTRRLRKSLTTIPKPRLTIFGGSTETYIESYTTVTDWTGGLLGRWLLMVGFSEHEAQDYAGDAGLRAELILRLRQMHGRGVVAAQGFTPEADALFRAWVRAHTIRARSPKTPDWMRSGMSRMGDMAMKLGLLLSFAEGKASDGQWWIGIEELQAAIVIVEAHAQSLHYVIEVLCGTPYQRRRMKVIEMLGEGPQTKAAIARELKISKRELDNLLGGVCEERTVVCITARNGLTYYNLKTLEDVLAEEESPENSLQNAVLGAAVGQQMAVDETLSVAEPPADAPLRPACAEG